MSYLLFTVYLIAGCFIIYRARWIRNSGLAVHYWLLFYGIKVGTGCFYGYWYSRPDNIATSDTWRLHHQALEEYRLLLNQPTIYLVNIFPNNEGGGILSTKGYWNNLKDNIMLKIISLMDVLSGGHYYVNVVIYSFITFFGFVFFYLACKNALHRTPSYLTAIAILFTPSCLFWTSGIHRDGFMLLLISLILYCISRLLYLREETGKGKTIFILVLSLGGLFFVRNYVAILLTPWLFILWLVQWYSLQPARLFCVGAIICLSFFFLSPYIHPALDLPARLLERRNAFEKLSGNSRIADFPIKPGTKSFILHLPKALNHAIFRPYFWHAKSIMEKMAAFELVVIMGVITALLINRNRGVHQDAVNLHWMIVFFSISILLVIGYTVPFSGAIVRYRAVFLMLMLTTFTFSWNENKKFQ